MHPSQRTVTPSPGTFSQHGRQHRWHRPGSWRGSCGRAPGRQEWQRPSGLVKRAPRPLLAGP
ncbi:MAG: hypothetical protein M0Z42_00630, partial [Actinomycetota bacterium]|nr:hypothetical protein [Actinomycetota bacterium]